MEATLLRSCLSLPKVAYMIHTCPPGLIHRALEEFDHTMRGAVSDITGCPLSNWAWLKASLPSSLGGLNIRQASLHAPAAFIGSFHQSEPLISEIQGHLARMPQHLPNTISALAKAAAQLEWLSIQCIDVSLHSHSLSRAVDESSYSLLLDSSPDVRSRALALSSAISHAGDWLNVVPSMALGLHLLDCEFRLCLCTGWGSKYLRREPNAQSATWLLILMGTTKWAVVVTGIVFSVTMPFVMQFFQQLSLQHLHHERKCHH